MKVRLTNKEFSKDSVTFNKACEAAHIPATARQASKWRRGKGKAYKEFMFTRGK